MFTATTRANDTFIGRLDPRVKIVWMFALSIIALRFSSLLPLMALFVIGVLPVWYFAGVISELGPESWRSRYLLLGVVSIQFLFALVGNIFHPTVAILIASAFYAIVLLLRLYIVIISAAVLYKLMNYADLSAAIRGMKTSRLPHWWDVLVEIVAFSLGTTYQLVPALHEEIETIVIVQRGRGIGVREGGGIERSKKLLRMGLPLFMRTIEFIKGVLIALFTSGYNRRVPRSALRVFHLRAVDWLSLSAIVAVVMLVLAFPIR